MEETWKDIAGYEGLYQVSNLGRVKSVERVITLSNGHPKTIPETILKPSSVSRGYLRVDLKRGAKRYALIHRLVAEAFIPNENLFATTVNHKDEDKTNNRVDNLEWMSQTENNRYSFAGPNGDRWGAEHPKAKSVRCIETGQVFGSQADASRWLGLRDTAVAAAIWRGSRSGGYHFEYINNDA